MEIEIKTENCDFKHNFLFGESASSRINIYLKLPIIFTIQSRRGLLMGLKAFIQAELAKFEWLIMGSVVVEFLWYLNSVERQETDKVGDMDNISKPIQDALIGSSGLLVDDSQIRGLYSYWQSRNDQVADNRLHIQIDFNNEFTALKSNLFFIQYARAICMPVNISDDERRRDLIFAGVLVSNRRKGRRLAQKSHKMLLDIDRHFVCSEWDYHRTRLNAFSPDRILSISQFVAICKDAGLTSSDFRPFLEKNKK